MTSKLSAIPHKCFSLLQSARRDTANVLPKVLDSPSRVVLEINEALGAAADHEDIQKAFPHTYGMPRVTIKNADADVVTLPDGLRIGVVLSGGQAPGGHNVIAGIYDYIKKLSPKSSMVGFLDGPHGVYSGRYVEIDGEFVDSYRNSGGFDMIGSGRHKIEKPSEFASSLANCMALNLDGLVVIGGDDSNTNAAILAEYFAANCCKTKVCGCPKTIDGDLKVEPYIPVSFGFDTACRTYSELIGNLSNDVLSSQKYYHFVRLMGRSASHIALECALQTRPNVCIICEEVQERGTTLLELTHQIVSVVLERSKTERNYGIILLPEGLIEFIPEFKVLIDEINDVLASGTQATETAVLDKLSEANRAIFSYLPEDIKLQLLLDRDPHGNVQVAKIETEKLLFQTVDIELKKLKASGEYTGRFVPQFHAFGYEGRSGLPSEFDATYCYALGQNVASLISLGQNGLISSVTNLLAPVADWACGGVPITMMCNMEKRHGHMKPVIKKALVELDGEPFKCFSSQRKDWALYDLYRSPGPMQFGQSQIELSITVNLELSKSDYRMSIEDLDVIKKMEDEILKTRKDEFVIYPLLDPMLTAVQNLKKGQIPVFSNDLAQKLSEAPEDPAVYGVLFCGRQAPGGHDIIAGLYDAVKSSGRLLGFIGGYTGLIKGQYIEITDSYLANYRGQGGYNLLCRHADDIEGSKEFDNVIATCKSLNVTKLVFIGGSRTSLITDTFSVYAKTTYPALTVVLAPADINWSVKSQVVPSSVGFDTITKVCSQIVGNNATDGRSAKKYYYFMRIIGHMASHSTLEVALLTKPNYAILSEEVYALHMTLQDIVNSIADVIEVRAAAGKNFGTVLIPEGLILAIPEMKGLIKSIDIAHAKLREDGLEPTLKAIKMQIPKWNVALLEALPEFIVEQLLLERCSDGSLQCAQVQTERLLAHFVDEELTQRKERGTYKGTTSFITQFLGYQARGSIPTVFDSNLAYNTGGMAAFLLKSGLSGYLAAVSNVTKPVADWICIPVHITDMVHKQPNVNKFNELHETVPAFMVDVQGPAYKAFASQRSRWAVDDLYENPGPIQFVGPAATSNCAILQYEFEV